MSNNKDFKVKNGIQPTVYHEGLGTVVSAVEGYALSNAEYDSISFNLSSAPAAGLTFNPDGTKMYVVNDSTNNMEQYSLSTAWDVSTASFDNISLNFGSQDTGPHDAVFNNDGTKVYMVGLATDAIYQYSLSTPYIIAGSYDSVSFSISGQDTAPRGIAISNDGTKLFVVGSTSDTIYQYSLSTAYDLSTASYNSVSFSVASQDVTPWSIAFNGDGTKMFISGAVNSTVFQYSLSTAFDLTTASYDSVSFSVASQGVSLKGLAFKGDGSKMYVGAANDTIYQYSTVQTTASLDLSTGSVFEVTPTSDIQVTLSNPADSGTVSGATLLLDGAGTTGYDLSNGSYDNVSFSVASEEDNATKVIFKPDGTKMYVTGTDSDAVQQYSLSSAFDVSTASYDSASFSVSSQDAGPMDISFNDDGTKLYMLGLFSDTLYQYSLSTAYDITTASYDSVSFSVTSQDGQPKGFTFNNDGTKLYYVGEANDSVYQYSLSTAFDLSTASYDSVSFSVNSQNSYPIAVSFNGDGTKMYVLGAAAPMSLFQYSLSTAFNLSTASYDSVSFDVSSQDTGLSSGITFSSDGTRLFLLGSGTRTVYQYSTATPATITYDTAIEWPSGTAPTPPAIGETDVVTFNTRDGGSTYQGVLAIDGAK